MRMRLRAKRGEKLESLKHGLVTFLETLESDKNKCKVIAFNRLVIIQKEDLPLNVIDTKYYEKIQEDSYVGD